MPAVADPVELDIAVVVDHDAEPADWDLALARFLLRVVRKRSRSQPGSPAAAVEVSQAPEAERQSDGEHFVSSKYR